MPSLYPLTFEPVLKDYIWGGRNLEKMLGRPLPPGIVAESWEIAGHEDGATIVANGPAAGLSLTQLQEKWGLDLIGHRAAWAYERGKFPLLIKLLDAHKRLSVQVHPDDDYALAHEGNELGKTEMWVVLHAEPDAAIILGVKEGTTREAFRQAVAEGRLETYLHRLPVKTGDFVCVPAGSVHAILGGLLIAEIQQNSNTTYRVYDWNRVDEEGRSRPLHIERALDVINFDQVEPALPRPIALPAPPGMERERLCRNQYFTVERLRLPAGSQFAGRCDGGSLEIWGVTEGKVEITVNDDGRLESAGVQFVLLPAALGDFTITAAADAALLRAYV